MTKKKATPAYMALDEVQQRVTELSQLAAKGLNGPELELLFSNAMSTLALAMRTTVVAVAHLECGDADKAKDAMTAMMEGLSSVIPTLVTQCATLNGEERLIEVSKRLSELRKKPTEAGIRTLPALDDDTTTPDKSAVEKQDAYYGAKFKIAEEAKKHEAALKKETLRSVI